MSDVRTRDERQGRAVIQVDQDIAFGAPGVMSSLEGLSSVPASAGSYIARSLVAAHFIETSSGLGRAGTSYFAGGSFGQFNTAMAATMQPVVSVAPAAMAETLERLERRIAALEQRIASRIAEAEAEVVDPPHDELTRRVRQFFKDHHGEAFDAAEVAEALGLSLWGVIDAIDEIEAAGGVKVVGEG